MKQTKILILTSARYSDRRIRDILIEDDFEPKYIVTVNSPGDIEAVLNVGVDLLIVDLDIHERPVEEFIIENKHYFLESKIIVRFPEILKEEEKLRIEKLKRMGITSFSSKMAQNRDYLTIANEVIPKVHWDKLPIVLTEEVDIDENASTTNKFRIGYSDIIDDMENVSDQTIYKKSEPKKQRQKSVFDNYEKSTDIELIIPKKELVKIEKIKTEESGKDYSSVDDFFADFEEKVDKKKDQEYEPSLIDKLSKLFKK